MGRLYRGQHEPLIPRELFDDVQKAITRPLSQSPRYRHHHPLFKGLIRCAACSGLLVWETKKGHWYGKCPKPRNCSRKQYVREERIRDQLILHIQALRSPAPNLVAWLRAGLMASIELELAAREAGVARLRERQFQLDAKLKTLYDDRLDGRITVELHDTKMAEIQTERNGIVRSISKLEAGDMSYIERGLTFLQLAQNAAGEFCKSSSIERRRDVMGELFDQLTLDGETLVCDYNRRAQWALKEARCEEWPQNDKFGPRDSGLTKTKGTLVGASRPIWLGKLDVIRTLFSEDVQA